MGFLFMLTLYLILGAIGCHILFEDQGEAVLRGARPSRQDNRALWSIAFTLIFISGAVLGLSWLFVCIHIGRFL